MSGQNKVMTTRICSPESCAIAFKDLKTLAPLPTN